MYIVKKISERNERVEGRKGVAEGLSHVTVNKRRWMCKTLNKYMRDE